MRTLAKIKKPTAKKPTRARSVSRIGSLSRSPRQPPAAKSTAADLLKIKDFGKGLNGPRVEAIIADRTR